MSFLLFWLLLLFVIIKEDRLRGSDGIEFEIKDAADALSVSVIVAVVKDLMRVWVISISLIWLKVIIEAVWSQQLQFHWSCNEYSTEDDNYFWIGNNSFFGHHQSVSCVVVVCCGTCTRTSWAKYYQVR